VSAVSSPYRTPGPVDRRIGDVDVVDALAAALDRIAARRRALVEEDRPGVLQVHWEPRGLAWNDTGEAPASKKPAHPVTRVHWRVAIVVACAFGLVAILAPAFFR